MLLTIFSGIYEFFCGTNPDSPEYKDNGIYDSVGWITLITVLVLAVIFYMAIGRWKPVFHKLIHWIIMVCICALIGFSTAFSSAKKELGAVDGYLIRFAILNAFFAALLFFLASLLAKRLSIFARRTPF